MTSVLLVEDDPAIYDAILPYMQPQRWRLIWVRSVTEAQAQLDATSVDVVLIDRGLPGAPGDVLAIRLAHGTTPFLMLTARSKEQDRIAGFDLGADDYVTKPFSVVELMRRIDVVLRRRGSPRVRLARDVELDSHARTVSVFGRPLALTPTEFKLLEQLARQAGRTFARNQLVELLGLDLDTSERALDSHVKNVRRKLREAGVEDEIIQTVAGFGYKLQRTS